MVTLQCDLHYTSDRIPFGVMFLHQWAWCTASLLPLANVALAQDISRAPSTKRWIAVVMAIVVVVGVVVASMKSSKRGHGD